MKIKQLEYLVKTVECGSISKAAQQLFISQPSLTKAIMGLEEEYGIQILVRKARGVELTVDGKSFIRYAHSVLTAVNALESNFSDKRAGRNSQLFVATQQLDFVYDLFLKTYLQNQDGSIHYNLVETDRNRVTRMVLDGKVDLGLMVRSSTDAKTHLWNTEAKKLNIHTIEQAGVYVCIGPYSPYYNRRSITYEEAENSFQVVLDMEEAATKDLFVDNVNNHFNTDKIVFFNSIGACERFLLQTDALMYVAKWAIKCFKDTRIRVLPVTNADPQTSELLWIKRAGEPIMPTEMQFLNHLYRHFHMDIPQNLDTIG